MNKCYPKGLPVWSRKKFFSATELPPLELLYLSMLNTLRNMGGHTVTNRRIAPTTTLWLKVPIPFYIEGTVGVTRHQRG